MRLLFEYEIGDQYTFWATQILPIIDESPESAFYDFVSVLEQARENYKIINDHKFSDRHSDPSKFIYEWKELCEKYGSLINGEFEWRGNTFNLSDFQSNLPNIMTVDEFFGNIEL